MLYIASGILFFLALFIFFFTDFFYELIENGSVWVREHFGGFYLWLGLLCVFTLIFIAFSRFGKIKLGNSPPEFDRLSWIAMLYSAGMGSGILLRAVQEPVFMFLNPPIETSFSSEVIALEYTFYQWGFTAWAFYGIFALLIAYSLFVRKSDILLGTSLPQLKRIKYLPEGVNLLTILTTVFGLVAAIGLGTTQIEGGISHLTSTPSGTLWLIVLLVFIICLVAFISAFAGINKGIKRISNWNIYITVILMFFVFFQIDILNVLSRFFESLYSYIVDFVPLSLALGKYNPGKEFLTDWTYYYWAFWLAWTPFTGIFIARISKGRSIREMVLGVLIIPSLGSFFWFSVFGSASFDLIGNMESYSGEFDNVFTSLFRFFEAFPLANFTNIVTIILLISFLVTSVDSAIYVLSMFSDKGKEHPRKKFRLIWAILILIFSEAIIILGNIKPDSNVLTAMQKFLIISSLPFAFFTAGIMILFIRELFKKH
ncbi:glycine/betaine ABC transporter [Salegentibacter salarius]|uniref:Glycine/betaine ABC transporter n=1 Tax=Salegentibacter salarius TaxID=435906 RepID=A0A2N0U0N6_9FLAO|nr:glycine/betaine ABC transporter [Salegentibacter salarius]PKD20539.1 glycine/betaine ABC transporter [Salegentibacter salarius]SLJ95622.1 glycine betaine transporter [Salegentibacter salarius]